MLNPAKSKPLNTLARATTFRPSVTFPEHGQRGTCLLTCTAVTPLKAMVLWETELPRLPASKGETSFDGTRYLLKIHHLEVAGQVVGMSGVSGARARAGDGRVSVA